MMSHARVHRGNIRLLKFDYKLTSLFGQLHQPAYYREKYRSITITVDGYGRHAERKKKALAGLT